MNKQENIPALRFPEFTENWVVKKLGDVAEIIMGQSPDGDSYNTIGLGTPLINGPVEFTEKYPVKIKWTSKPTKFCQDKDVLFCVRGSTTGRMNIANDKYCIGRGVAAIRANKHSTSLFIEFILIRNLEVILSFTTGSTFQNIDSKSLREFDFQIPTLPEQQKIATFLSAVDEKLQGLKKKKSLLEAYKKGMMQRLFSSESGLTRLEDEQDLDDNNPTILTSRKLRFRQDNGEDFPDWEEKTLGEVGNFMGGGTPSTKNVEYWNGNIPWISSSDLVDDSIHQIRTTRFITNDAITNSATKLIPKNSILIVSRVGVGKIAVTETEVCTSQDFTSLNPFSDNHIFLAYLLKIKTKELLEFNQGTSIKGFVKSDLETLKIALPTLPEQTKIANFLSAIDEKIAKVSQEIEQATVWKKGLLQQLFV